MTAPDEKRVQNLLRQHLSCKHFNGVQHDRCKAGVNYRETFPPPWGKGGLPCIEHGSTLCDKADWPTNDEARAAALESIAATERMLAPLRAVHQDAKSRGLGKGHGGANSCTCPNCGGLISYSVAAVNGHVCARCSTQGCVAWIE